MGQNTEPRNKFMTMGPSTYNGEKAVSAINSMGKTKQLHAKE